MTQAHKTPGNFVRLHYKVYSASYAPHYEHTRDQVYEVLDGNILYGHVKVRNVNNHDEQWTFHDDELVSVKKS